MTIAQKRFNTGIWFFIFYLCVFATLGNAEPKDTTTVTVETQNGNLVIKAHDARLGDLLEKISGVCQVDLRGLANRENETINFESGNGPIEPELKRLLRYLNVGNYTFEYWGDQLRIVSVFPKSDTEIPEPPITSDTQQTIKKRRVKAVKVVGIIEGSQAETLNLMEGDFVVSYGGAKISTATQLIKLVNSKPDSEVVDMIVVRDGRPLSLVVNGGQIGIRIKTEQIPSGILSPDL